MKIDVHSHIFDRRYFEAMWRDFELERSTTPQGQTLMRRNGYTYMWYREPFFDIDHRLRLPAPRIGAHESATADLAADQAAALGLGIGAAHCADRHT